MLTEELARSRTSARLVAAEEIASCGHLVGLSQRAGRDTKSPALPLSIHGAYASSQATHHV